MFHFSLSNSPAVAANIYDASFSATTAGQFYNWVLSLKLAKPMQVINTRFAKRVSGEDDMMPVVSTAVSVLSKTGTPVLKEYYRLASQLYRYEQKVRALKRDLATLKKGLPLVRSRPRNNK
jgi:hypothetical protein